MFQYKKHVCDKYLPGNKMYYASLSVVFATLCDKFYFLHCFFFFSTLHTLVFLLEMDLSIGSRQTLVL